MNTTTQRILVRSHISALEAEAAAERLGLAARANHPRKPSVRAVLGRGMIAVGAAIASTPIVDDPCADAGAARGT
ncbi:MAG TPA: hypothetical protein VGQ58_10460 [Candidatus Limnocylindrales bacterium]|jgi:hypothetical protein|nr:hypothetical protein [Candidatus Limnocylindrales bacterium]